MLARHTALFRAQTARAFEWLIGVVRRIEREIGFFAIVYIAIIACRLIGLGSIKLQWPVAIQSVPVPQARPNGICFTPNQYRKR